MLKEPPTSMVLIKIALEPRPRSLPDRPPVQGQSRSAENHRLAGFRQHRSQHTPQVMAYPNIDVREFRPQLFGTTLKCPFGWSSI